MATLRNAGFTAKPTNPMYTVGEKLTTVHAQVAVVAATANDGDFAILAGPFNADQRIHRIMSPNATPALTSATDNDIGFYRLKEDGTFEVVDKDIIVDGGSLASALTTRDLLSLNAALDRKKTIGELLSLTSDNFYAGGVYLALTFNTKSTADGTLDLDIVIQQGN